MARKDTTSSKIDPEQRQAKGPVLMGIESILAKCNKKESAFSVSVGGDLLFFRMPTSTSELDAFVKEGVGFVIRLRSKEERAKFSPQIQEAIVYAEELGPRDDRDFMNAFCVAFWSANEQRITQAQGIRLSRNPSLLQLIVDRIDEEHTNGMRVLSLGGVTFEKKESTPTSGTSVPSGRRSSTGAKSRNNSPNPS